MSVKPIYLLLCSCCFVLLSYYANAQSDSLAFMRYFQNRESVQWKLKGTKIVLGEKCVNGEYLTFHKDQAFTKKVCDIATKNWAPTNSNWQLVKVKTEWQLLIGGQAYSFSVRKKDKKTTLTLRTIPATREAIITTYYDLN